MLKYVFMNYAYLSSFELLIFFKMKYQRKINSNQQIGGRAAVCQKADLSAIILTGCHNWGEERGGCRHNTHCEVLLMQVIVFHYKQDDDTNI